jgi:hypothetical protein
MPRSKLIGTSLPWSAAHGGNAAREAIRAFSLNVRMKPTGAMDGRIGDQTGYAG